MQATDMESVVRVPLTRGMFAIVDEADAPLTVFRSWYAHRNNSRRVWYAYTAIDRLTVAMHRLILGAPDGIEVDHCDGNGLNNRRENIRLATHSQNQANQPKLRGLSQFKGVYWKRDVRKWAAQIKKDGRKIPLGRFATEVEAAIAYNVAAAELFGEFARLNEITEEVSSSHPACR